MDVLGVPRSYSIILLSVASLIGNSFWRRDSVQIYNKKYVFVLLGQTLCTVWYSIWYWTLQDCDMILFDTPIFVTHSRHKGDCFHAS